MREIHGRTSRPILACFGMPLLAMVLVMSAASAADTGIDPAHKYAWGENIGWASAQSADHNVSVHYDESSGGWLSGHVWAANIGWIVMGSAGGGPYGNTTVGNWGVNLAADGKLTGYAWGENVGWINFEQEHGQPAINIANGEFSGYAWGENIGWVKFRGASPDYGVRTLAFDTQSKGTPNWWLAKHGVDEDYDAGDNVPAWRKFVMDTDPNVEGDYLRITSILSEEGETDVTFIPASTRRYYTLSRREDLMEGDWSSVVGQISIPGVGGEQTLTDEEPATTMFYGVTVKVDP
jgi:hypothetical protein